ncbi:hypothetical protein BH11PSE8_BH11PSE8_00640 [soil metagenome]
MAGYRFPGTIGDGFSTLIDAGTMMRAFSPPPGFFRPADYAKDWVRQQIRRGAATLTLAAGALAYDAVMHELRALRGDIQAKIDYISRLPKEMRDQVAYDFFASFFDHYLPKKFLRNYIWGKGTPIKLTLQEMKDCNPMIDLNASKPFVARVTKLQAEAAAKNAQVVYPFTLEMVAGAATNGSLGQFTVKFKGQIDAEPDGSWLAKGTMEFSDTWDFDPRDAATGGRSGQGEAKTRFADQVLPGTPFEISSESTAFEQTQADALIVWAGGTPKAELDKVSKSDLAIGRLDR